MWLGAVSVLVVLASGDPGDGSTRAIEQALRTALGPDAQILLERSPAQPADVVCVVTWSGQRRVLVRSAKAGTEDWSTRELRFDPADAPNERGRTVGLALASMMPEEPPPPPPTAVASGQSDEEQALFASLFPREAPPPPRDPLPRPNPLAIDAVAVATNGLGGAFALRLPLVGALGLHAGLSGRAGSVDHADLRTFVGSAGLAWQPWLDARRRWAAGVRVDANVFYLDVGRQHLDDDDHNRSSPPSTGFGFGASALAEGTYRFTSHAAFVSAIGAEVQLDRSDQPVNVVAELGLRVMFP